MPHKAKIAGTQPSMANVSRNEPEVSVEDASIVMLGDFNPKIFHPMWFAQQGLLRESEAGDAKIEVVHQDVSAFSTDWFTVQVLRDRFTASIKAQAYIAHLGDLVQGVFQKLVHTPVRQLGMNVTERIRFKTDEDWHGFGHFVLPKAPWDGVLAKPGLRAAHIQGQRSSDVPGYVIISVEPDLQTTNDALIRVNDHYEIVQSDVRQQGASWAVAIIERGFEGSITRGLAAINQLIQNFRKTEGVDKGRAK